MAARAEALGGKYTSVSTIKGNISNSGYTSSVTVSTNRGVVTIDGSTFKTVYNLRAPAYISIKSRLFGFEKK